MNEAVEQQQSSQSKNIFEYQYLRLEIIERIKLRQQLVISSLILAASLLGIGITESSKIALIYSPLIVFLALAWSQNDYAIERAAKYIRIYFENANSEYYGWENYVEDKRLGKLRTVVISHYGLFIITQIMAIVIGSLNSNTTRIEFWLLIILNIIGIIFIVVLAILSEKKKATNK